MFTSFSGFYSQPKYIRNYHTKSGGNVFGYISQISKEELDQKDYSKTTNRNKWSRKSL